MVKTPELLSPIQLGNVSLRNRVVMAALTRNRSVPTNVPNEVNVEYYKQRAAGGAGLIVTEGALVSQQGAEWCHAPGMWSAEHVTAWKKVTDAVHSEDGVIFAQLWHTGRAAHPDAPEQKASGKPVYAPSAIAARGGKFRFIPGAPGYVTPTAIDDPRVLISDFKAAAINAKNAGFDGVELHGANGYLIHQFIDNTSNHRTDEWGGSVENRARFALETLKVLVDVWGPGRVGVKFSPGGGYNDMGMPLQDTLDTYSYLISEVDKLGLAYIALIRAVSKLDFVFNGESRMTSHDVLASYRPYIKNTNLILNGDVTPDEGDALIKQGKINAVQFGWLWIANPDLVKRLEQEVIIDGEVDVHGLYNGVDETIDGQRPGYTDYKFVTEVKL